MYNASNNDTIIDNMYVWITCKYCSEAATNSFVFILARRLDQHSNNNIQIVF
jgi:hypothetical protein